MRKHEADLKKDNMVFNVLGYVKLFLVLLMGILMYHIFTKEFPFELIISCAAAFIILVILWIYHNRLHDNINYSKGIISICNRQLDRITGKWTAFEDTGAEFIDAEHAYACDLDIIGSKSLFQFLNTTYTWHGRQVFANDLLRPAYGRAELQERQEAISELSNDIDFASDVQYHLSQIGVDSSAVKLVEELKDKKPFAKHTAVKILLNYTPVLTFIFIAAIIVFQQKNLYLAGAIIVLIQAIIWIAGMPKTQKYLGVMAHLPYKLSAYSTVIEILKDKDFSSEKLKRIKEQLNVASQAIKDLGKIADKISAKHNGIIYFIVNVFLLWDYECAFLLEEWKSKYSHLAEEWFVAVGEFESLLCFSHLPNACNNTCLPVISEKDDVIEAREMGHPLLPNEIRINNDLQFGNNIFIISGSNMSGKTTFLRTAGVNLVLARSGGFVCAQQMTCSPFDIMTSMRIADDLNEGVSTFYAELKRIKGIVDFAHKRPNMIFLIDEIFRGTNSVDRLTGAKTVISKLNALGVTGMISTHDLELCELANIYSRIKNYSFSEHYKDNSIHFDYKMKPGKSKTTNAKYLMEMVGI